MNVYRRLESTHQARRRLFPAAWTSCLFALALVLPASRYAHAQPAEELVNFKIKTDAAEVRRGETIRVTITGTPRTGYHTYPVTQRSEDPLQDDSGLTRLKFEPAPGLQMLQPIGESKPEWGLAKPTGVMLEFREPFQWDIDLLALPEAKPGTVPATFKLRFLACDEDHCVPGEKELPTEIRISKDPPVPLAAGLQSRLNAAAPEIKVVTVPRELRGKMSAVVAPAGAANAPKITEKTTAEATPPAAAAEVSWLQQIVLAMGAGWLMLLTPCVFPMIPVTVSFFLKQGEKEHNSPLILASVYAGTIVVLLTLAVSLLGNVIAALANNVWLNLAMGIVLTVFALSLFGMFELELPHFLVRYTSTREGTGYVGAFFMALTFTINGFTCTGPFLGILLGAVKELKLSWLQVFTSALAYSIAFAAPFFVLAVFPRLLKALPKSGGWLNAVKVVMAFLEIALAVKFFSITDAGLFPGNPRFFNYDTVLCAWMALSVACGLYLLGFFRLPHDSPLDHIGVPRLLFACLFLGLAVYMTPLLSRNVPLGTVGEGIVAMLPLDSREVENSAPGKAVAAQATEAPLEWSRDYQEVWKKAKAENKLIFIDFTGRNCTNCRANEKTVFPRTEVRAELEKFVLAQLYTDGVPDRRLSKEESESQAERNKVLQGNTFGDVSLPLYAVIDPSGTSEPFIDGNKLAGKIRGKATGTIHDVTAFVDLLKRAATETVALRR